MKKPCVNMKLPPIIMKTDHRDVCVLNYMKFICKDKSLFLDLSLRSEETSQNVGHSP